MLNSNYFSKRTFIQNLQVFNLWLEQQYYISCSKDNDVFTQQVHFYHSYIKFLNYRQKHIQQFNTRIKNTMHTQFSYLLSIEKELLEPNTIKSYSKYIA